MTQAAPDAPSMPASAEQHRVFDDLAESLALAEAAVARAGNPDRPSTSTLNGSSSGVNEERHATGPHPESMDVTPQ
jgi:hypothetical protein